MKSPQSHLSDFALSLRLLLHFYLSLAHSELSPLLLKIYVLLKLWASLYLPHLLSLPNFLKKAVSISFFTLLPPIYPFQNVSHSNIFIDPALSQITGKSVLNSVTSIHGVTLALSTLFDFWFSSESLLTNMSLAFLSLSL